MWTTLFKNNRPWLLVLVIYHALAAFIIWRNFPAAGQFLTGWDALHPEFGFGLNAQRSLAAVWQESYGTGALVGHGFASLMPHTVITWLLSLILPLWAVRPFFLLLCYYLGGLGMMVFARKIGIKLFSGENQLTAVISLLAGLFYLLNLGTVQQFYLPLEAFTVQFAWLPWFFWSLEKYREKPTRIALIVFALINLLGSVQGFIPTLFVAFMLVFSGWCFTLLLVQKRKFIRTIWPALLTVLLINAYWLLPFGYYVVGNSGDFLQAYNNQLSTPEFAASSEAYGTFSDTVLLKSFYLDGAQPDGKVFAPWLGHVNSQAYQLIGWIFFVCIAFGWVSLLLQRQKPQLRAYAVAGLIAFGFLASQVPPFSWYLNSFYEHSDLFRQLFRTSFTKFGLLTAGFYSLFFGIGLASLLVKSKKIFARLAIKETAVIGVCALLFLGWPILRGNLFDRQLVTKIPGAYFSVMNYFKTAGEGRIAEVPIECSEGWYTRPWGYYGSGFMWFGIRQPYLSRTFDVWNQANESFYFESRYALRQPNYDGFSEVLEKYAVRWLYLDSNLIHCQNGDGLEYLEGLEAYLQSSPNFRLTGEYADSDLQQPLKIFEFSPAATSAVTAPQAYVNGSQPLTLGLDRIYSRYGSFLSDQTSPDVSYLYGDHSLTIGSEEILVQQKTAESGLLQLSSYFDTERVMPIKISLEPAGATGLYTGTIAFLGPTVTVQNQLLVEPPQLSFGPVAIQNLTDLQLAADNIGMKKLSDTEFIGTFFVGENNSLVALESGSQKIWWQSGNEVLLSQYLNREIEVPVGAGDEITISMPKVFDQGRFGNVIQAADFPLPVDCSETDKEGERYYELGRTEASPLMRLISRNDNSCLRLNFEDVLTGSGYLIQLVSRHSAGLPLRYGLTNWRDISYLDNYLPGSDQITETVFVVPPVFEWDLNYTFEIGNYSFGDQSTVNDIYRAEYWFLPYRYAMSGRVIAQNFSPAENTLAVANIRRIGAIGYTADISGGGLLLLQQSFDEGWIGLRGLTLLRHTQANGWANGWLLPEGKYTVLLLYWPQLFSFLGFGLLIGTAFWLLKQRA